MLKDTRQMPASTRVRGVSARTPTFALLALIIALGGCTTATNGGSTAAGSSGQQASAEAAGLGAGLGIGLATGNPFIGLAVAVGLRVIASETVAYMDRKSQQEINLRIADVAGQISPGETKEWTATNFFGSQSWGWVHVTRTYGEKIPCKEIVYTEEDVDYGSVYYVASVCRSAGQWRWAMPLPTTAKWPALQ